MSDEKRKLEAEEIQQLELELVDDCKKLEEYQEIIDEKEKKIRILKSTREVDDILSQISNDKTILFAFNRKNPRVECLETVISSNSDHALVLNEEDFSYFFDVERSLRDGPENMDWNLSGFDECDGQCNSERKKCPSNEVIYKGRSLPKKIKVKEKFEIHLPNQNDSADDANDANLVNDKWNGTSEFDCSHVEMGITVLISSEMLKIVEMQYQWYLIRK